MNTKDDVTNALLLKVAEALYRMSYLENWGSGVRRIMDTLFVKVRQRVANGLL